jgi:hypothetical protein
MYLHIHTRHMLSCELINNRCDVCLFVWIRIFERYLQVNALHDGVYKKVSRNKELMDWFDSMVGLDDVRFFSLYKLFRSIHISSSSLKTLSQFRTWSSRHGGP